MNECDRWWHFYCIFKTIDQSDKFRVCYCYLGSLIWNGICQKTTNSNVITHTEQWHGNEQINQSIKFDQRLVEMEIAKNLPFNCTSHPHASHTQNAWLWFGEIGIQNAYCYFNFKFKNAFVWVLLHCIRCAYWLTWIQVPFISLFVFVVAVFISNLLLFGREKILTNQHRTPINFAFQKTVLSWLCWNFFDAFGSVVWFAHEKN